MVQSQGPRIVYSSSKKPRDCTVHPGGAGRGEKNNDRKVGSKTEGKHYQKGNYCVSEDRAGERTNRARSQAEKEEEDWEGNRLKR